MRHEAASPGENTHEAHRLDQMWACHSGLQTSQELEVSAAAREAWPTATNRPLDHCQQSNEGYNLVSHLQNNTLYFHNLP